MNGPGGTAHQLIVVDSVLHYDIQFGIVHLQQVVQLLGLQNSQRETILEQYILHSMLSRLESIMSIIVQLLTSVWLLNAVLRLLHLGPSFDRWCIVSRCI